jgi:hypothetical protein
MKLLTAKDFNPTDFKTASLCPATRRGCVQVAMKDGTIAIGDSKHPKQTPLLFNQDEWQTFIAGVKQGEFDI